MNVASELLIERALRHSPAVRVCVFGGEAELAMGLARENHADTLTWLPTDCREMAMIGQHEHENIVVDDNVMDPGVELASVDLAILPATPDRDLNRRSLALAARLLSPNGALILAGANAEGIRSAIADAIAVFGPPTVEDFRRKHRIAVLQRTNGVARPGWLTTPGIAAGTWREFSTSVMDQELSLVTLPGVFAKGALDAGTALLLAHLDVSPGTRVLDAGCGAGAIGIAAARAGAAEVDLVDVSLLAVAAARENLRRLAIANARAFASDVYGAVENDRYNLIVSNPPFHQGKDNDRSVADRLIREAPRHLLPGGSLLIVANAFLAYGMTISEEFGHVETVAATRQYHVIAARDPR